MAPFDPADAGTPEQEWLRLLNGAQEWSPGKGPLVVVAPHPDDEVLGAGGLMQCWAAAGQSVTIVSVTDGEAANRQIIEQHATAGSTLVGPYEHDGHPDHDVVGRLCGEVARAARLTLARYPVWTWHHTHPTSVKSLPWVRFPLTCAARRAKARALQCFASQVRPPSGEPIVPPHVLDHFHRPYEAFVL